MTTSGPEFYKAELDAERIAALLESRELTPNEVVEGLWHGSALVRRNAARGARYVRELPDPGEAMLKIASKDPDEAVRSAVVAAVAGGLAGLPVAMRLLFDAVLDKGEGIRDTAIQGLESRLVSDPFALPYLIEALGDVRAAVSAVASQLLIKVGGERAANALVALLGHGDPQRRRTAYDVLERLSRLVVGELVDAVRDPVIRPLATKLIAGLGDVEAVHRETLESYLHGDTKLAEDVGRLLASLGRPVEPPRTAPLDIPVADFLVRRLDDSELLDSDLDAVALSELLHALRDGRDVVRANAAQALGLHPAVSGDETLAALAANRLGPAVRDAAASVRVEALRSLARLGHADGVALLVMGLEDTSPHARAVALDGLVSFGTTGFVRALEALVAPARAPIISGLREVAARIGATLTEPIADAMAGAFLGSLGREVAAVAVGDLGADAEAAVPALLNLLRDPIEEVRVAAASSLGFIGLEDPVIIEELRRRLNDPVAAVRRAAALAAARIAGRPIDDRGASDANIVAIAGFETERLAREVFEGHEVPLENLIKALRDGRDIVKINAATAIGALGDSGQAGTQPLAMLLRDASVEVRVSAVVAMAALGKAALPGAWFLTSGLSDPDAGVRDAVADVLVGLHPECEDFLIEALRSDTEVARRGVFVVLDRLGRLAVPLLTRALGNGSGRIRLNAAIALELLARQGADEAVAALENRLVDPIGDVRVAAQSALDAILGGKPKPVVVLEPDPVAIEGFDERVVAPDVLEEQRAQTTPERMLRALRDGRAFVRQNAATVLGAMAIHGEVEPQSVVPPLAVALRDGSVGVKKAVAHALGLVGRMGSHEVGPVLVHALEDKHEEVRDVARQGLVGLGVQALPSLVEGLLRLAPLASLPVEEAVSRSVLPLLKRLAVEVDGDAVIGALRGALELASSPLRTGALRALRHIGRERAEALRALVLRLENDGDSQVSREARATHDHLDGKDIAPAAAPALPLPSDMVERVLDFETLQQVIADAGGLEINLVLKATQDGREVVRQNAARAVALLEDPPKRAAMALAILLRDADADVRLAAAESLQRRGPAFAAPVGFWLTVALQDPEPRIRELVTTVLAMVHEVAPDAIVEGLRVDPDLAYETIMVVLDRLGRPAVPTLEGALSNPSGLIRLNAARGLELLSKRGADQALDALKARDRDPIGQVRIAAQAAIDAIQGGRPRPPRVLEPDPVLIEGFDDKLCDAAYLEAERSMTTPERIARALRDGRPFVRHNAALVLGAMVAHEEVGSLDAVQALSVATKDAVALVRRAAVFALARVKGEAGHEGHLRLIAALDDKNQDVREAAQTALMELGTEAFQALTEGLAALVAPSSLPPSEAEKRSVLPVWRALIQADTQAVQALGAALSDSSPLIRAGALLALRKVGRDHVQVLRDRVAGLRDPDETVVREARATLDHIEGRDELPAAAPALPLPDAMILSGLGLENLRPIAAELEIDVILKATQDGRTFVRQNAARLIGLVAEPPKRAAMSLAMLLRDGERDVRAAAAETLFAMGPVFAAPVGQWLSAALRDPDAEIRDTVANTLSLVHEEAPDALIEGLRVDPEDAHDGILVAVERIGERCVRTLGRALHNPSGLIRMNAAQGLEVLAKRGAGEELDNLEGKLSDPIAQVRRFVASAIDAIKGGRPRPPRVLEPDPIEVNEFSVRLLDEAVLAPHAGNISIPRLHRALADGRSWVRANASTLLGFDPDYTTVGPLAVLARDGVAVVRGRAISALARVAGRGGPELALTVVAGALSDRHEAVRLAAQSGLAALGSDNTGVLHALTHALADIVRPSPAFAALVGLLHQQSEDQVVSVLGSALSPARPELHAGVLAALREAVGAEILQPLRAHVDLLQRGQLGDGSPAVRDEALLLLDKIDGKDLAPTSLDPVPLPLAGFADGLLSREVLAEAANELRLDLLTHALADGRDIVRANAVYGLEVLGSAQQVALPLVARMLRDPHAEVRVRAAETLGHLPPRRDLAFELAAALADPSPRVVRAAESSLARYGEFALDAFMYSLDDAPRIVGKSILPMLASLGEKALDTLVLAQRYDSPLVRRNALTALMLMPRELASQVRPAVALARRDEHRDVRLEALTVLEWIDGIVHVLVLEPRPLPTPDYADRVLTRDELARLTDFDRTILQDLLLDGRRHVRENTCLAYGVLGLYHPWLPIRLKDDRVEVQRAAVHALKSLSLLALAAAPALIEALSEDDEELRQVAREALQGLGVKALPALIAALWAPADRVRKTVLPIIEALGKEATPAIIAALDHPSQLVTLNALLILTRLYGVDPEGAVLGMPRVIQLTRHVLPAIIGSAQKCLFRLEGRTPAEFQKDPVPMPITGFDKGPLAAEILASQAPGLDVAWTISALADGRPIVRENAARAVGYMPSVIKDLLIPLTIALKDSVPEVQVAAADAFATLKSQDEVAIPALTFALKDATERVRRACMVALDAYGPERVALVLVKHLVGREDWMLVTIGRVAARMNEVLVPALMRHALDKSQSLIGRENAVKIIADLSARARGVEHELLKLLPEMEGMLACKAAFAIGRVARPSKDLIESMLAHLSKDPRPSLHREVRDSVKIIKRRLPVG